MPTRIIPLIAGNWKMNGLRSAIGEVERLLGLLAAGPEPACDIALCPPSTLLAAIADRLQGTSIATGGQDCHPAEGGPHTGDISARMLADAGAQYVIVGHSERRAAHGETDALVAAKGKAAIGAGLTPIVCVGETQEQRQSGAAEAIVERQLLGSMPDGGRNDQVVIAYEPIWAIGTGRTPTGYEIARMHYAIRRVLAARLGTRGTTVRILYGGSLQPANAAEILAIPEVNGGLVGGASLLSSDFHAIISAVE